MPTAAVGALRQHGMDFGCQAVGACGYEDEDPSQCEDISRPKGSTSQNLKPPSDNRIINDQCFTSRRLHQSSVNLWFCYRVA